MSIVPRQAAPVPQWAQQIYGNGEPTAPRSYAATDWSRLGIPPAQLVQWQGNPDTGGQYVYGQAAIPPGFTQASYPSQYGPQWRGAAFGPSGRMGATSNNRATTYYGPGFEPPAPYVPPPFNLRDLPGFPGTPPPPYVPPTETGDNNPNRPVLPPWNPKMGGTVRGPDVKPPNYDPNFGGPPPWVDTPSNAPPWNPKMGGIVRGPDVVGGAPRPYSPGVGMPDTGVAFPGPVPWNPHPATPKPPSTKVGTVRGPEVVGGAPRPYSPGVGVPDTSAETTMKPAIRWPKKMSKGWV